MPFYVCKTASVTATTIEFVVLLHSYKYIESAAKFTRHHIYTHAKHLACETRLIVDVDLVDPLTNWAYQ